VIVSVTFAWEKMGAWMPEKRETILVAASVVIAMILSVQTFSYNRVWLSDLALWRHAVTVDDTSATNWRQLGAELVEQNDLDGARDAYGRSLDIRKDPLALMGSSRVSIAKGDFGSAVRDLETVIGLPPENVNAYTLFQSYESLAIAQQQQKHYADAERSLREARDRLPIYRAALTEKLAVILYLQNRKQDALGELESVRNKARTEMLIASKSVFLRLGMLYAELGRKPEAKVALEEFLAATANARDKGTLDERRLGAQLLQSVR
jgi:tetratricopeptide (TPR) repeat protein